MGYLSGVQLVGRPADEATLFSLAAQLEVANPFYHQQPKLAVEEGIDRG